MSNKLKLQTGQTYTLKAESITDCTKDFNTKEGRKYRYDVTLVNKDGERDVYEYLDTRCYEPGTRPQGFEKNLFQFFRCKFADEKGATIEPTEEPGVRMNVGMPNQIPKDAKQGEYVASKQYLSSGTEKLASFSMSYAKDILVAKIEATKTAPTDEDLDTMIKWFHKINGAMVDVAEF